VHGNVGFVFTNEDINEIRSVVVDNVVAAAAKPGDIAPNGACVLLCECVCVC